MAAHATCTKAGSDGDLRSNVMGSSLEGGGDTKLGKSASLVDGVGVRGVNEKDGDRG